MPSIELARLIKEKTNMSHKLLGSVIVITLSLAVSFARSEPRRGGGGRSGGEQSAEERSGGERSSNERSGSQAKKGKKPPGGAWSEYNSSGKQDKEQSGKGHNESGDEGAAAGAAHSNRNNPQYSGAQGAAAGAAVSNRNGPQYSGAQGAAAGAAVANRNSPQYSGAAAGYAAVRNNVDHPGMYSQQWYGEHQGAWAPA